MTMKLLLMLLLVKGKITNLHQSCKHIGFHTYSGLFTVITKLKNSGYIRIEKHGRVNTVFITQKGEHVCNNILNNLQY